MEAQAQQQNAAAGQTDNDCDHDDNVSGKDSDNESDEEHDRDEYDDAHDSDDHRHSDDRPLHGERTPVLLQNRSLYADCLSHLQCSLFATFASQQCLSIPMLSQTL